MRCIRVLWWVGCIMMALCQVRADAAEKAPVGREYRSVIQEYGRPLGFRTADGQVTGFSVEVMDAVAERAGIAIRHTVVASYAELVEVFRSGAADMTPSVAISPDRARFFDFTTPYESIPLLIFVRADSTTIQAITPGLRVGAVHASAAVGYLGKVDGIHLHLYPGYEEVITALLERRIDAFTASAERVRGMLNEHGFAEKIKAVGHPVGVVQRAIAVKKGDDLLRDRLDGAVKEFLASPDARRIHEKWFGGADE